MEVIIEDSVIIQKTKDLCQTLVDQPEFQSIRQRIELFLSDEKARTQYQVVMEKGDALQHKQQQGLPLDNSEITDFEQNRDALLANTVARSFIDAQQEMHKMQESVMQFVTKTFELGRVPVPEDFSSGDCGPTCGCDH